jgi:glycosyltransferase involved in cell wall biosynthesis
MQVNASKESIRPIVFFGQGASRSGAPIALLDLLRWWKAETDLPFRVVLSHGGPLAANFAELAPTVVLTEIGAGRSRLVKTIGHMPLLGSCLKNLWHRTVTPGAVGREPSLVYANSLATAPLIERVVPPGVPLLVHVHELERIIQSTAGTEGMARFRSIAQRYIAVSSPVKENLIVNHGIDSSMIEVIPSFIPIEESIPEKSNERRRAMRRGLGIPADVPVVAGCGATEWRKGVDLFVEHADLVRAKLVGTPVHFVWIGKVVDDEFTRSIMRQVRDRGLSSLFHFAGEQEKPVELFPGCDVFVLSSREEAMGLVALEAASVGKPIVCFAGAGGMPDFVAHECGKVVSRMTADALADAVIELVSSVDSRTSLGLRAFEKVRRTHHINVIAPRIVKVVEEVACCS